MPKHDFVDNGLNDYCLTCDLPMYSAVHEAGVTNGTSTIPFDLGIERCTHGADLVAAVAAQEKAKRLGDLIDSGRLVRG